MPSIEHAGTHLYYEEFGSGFPILTFAPAGLASTIAVWSRPMAPINVTTELAATYRVIAMDQRNAGGRSHAPITARDSWDSYTADHLAVLDHLGIEKCHLYGQCIGGSFILNLLKAQPDRVAAAVLAQPIGRAGDAALPAFQRMGRVAERSSRGDTGGAGCIRQQSLRQRLRLLRGPRVRPHDKDPVPGPGRQRRSASLSDLRGTRPAAAELRVRA